MENVKTDNHEGLARLFDQYEENKSSENSESNSNSRGNTLAKYFKVTNNRETFRILPPLDLPNGKKRDYIEFAYFHNTPVLVANGKKQYRKIYCPAHNDPRVPRLDENGQPVLDRSGNPVTTKARCPLCERADNLLKQQDSSIRGVKKEDYTSEQEKIRENNDKIYEQAKPFIARKFYIVRGVDKGQMKDGVKYWRFPHNKRNEGNYTKLIAAIQQFMNEHKVDFTNINEGCDFNIIATNATFNGVEYKKVTSIMPTGKTPLHPDPVIIQSLLEDKSTWRDVFKPAGMRVLSGEEYLERVVRGTNPYWDDSDQDNKKWVFPDPADKELEEKANTRDENLDADNSDKYYEQASDIVIGAYTTTAKVEEVDNGDDDFTAKSVVNKEPVTQPSVVKTEVKESVVTSTESFDEYEDDDVDDLPF